MQNVLSLAMERFRLACSLLLLMLVAALMWRLGWGIMLP